MASQPPTEPESIIVGQFAGIRNTISEERLQQGDLASAVNVDIDDAGQLRRRRGFTRQDNANYHSLRTIVGHTLVVKDGWLGILYPDYSHAPIVEVGMDQLSYTSVGDVVYYSSETASGKLLYDNTREPWGQTGGDGQWVSPVIRPTETLGAISGKNLSAPPMASEIAAYKGRIYLGSGRVLWATELYLYDLVDKTRNFLYLEDDVTMIAPVGGGIYVGTTRQLLYLAGTFAQGLKLTPVMDSPVLRGSLTYVPQSKVHPDARRGNPVVEDEVPVFMTERGICCGLDNGQVYNLTQDRMLFPEAQSAAVLYREDQGVSTYLAVADSAGGFRANTRIGDYVDAEIVRASQGG